MSDLQKDIELINDHLVWGDYYEVWQRIRDTLFGRIAELEADAERYRVALVDCMEWMESGRESTDWVFWDWNEGDVYMRAKAAIDAARKA